MTSNIIEKYFELSNFHLHNLMLKNKSGVENLPFLVIICYANIAGFLALTLKQMWNGLFSEPYETIGEVNQFCFLF